MLQAVTFDFGQTLVELDSEFLSRRLRERGADAHREAIAAAIPIAWRAYDDAIRSGHGGHPWKFLMRRLLELAATKCARDDVATIVDWLWLEQPRRNLWRQPIEGMIELVQDLRRRGLRTAVISNSEGRLAELADELGWTRHFDLVADSGRLGIEKPDRRIFDWTLARLGVSPSNALHIGDSYEADVRGARNAGMHAALFRGFLPPDQPDLISQASSAAEIAVIIQRLGVANSG